MHNKYRRGVGSLRKFAGTFLLFCLMCYVAIYISFSAVPVSNISGSTGTASNTAVIDGNDQQDIPAASLVKASGETEKSAYDFIMRNLTGADGSIATNVRKYEGSSDTLSESVGLLLNYSVLSKNKELFDKELPFLRKNLLTEDFLARWRVGKSEAFCNAAVDDLRIAGALLDAYDLWGDEEYYNLAGFMQDAIYEKQVKDGNLYEFYDWKSGQCKQSIPLCYLDLYTMDRSGNFNKGWLKVEDKAIAIIKNGRIADKSPFYYKFYDYNSGNYSLDEEYGKGKGICLTYTLYTNLHLAEVNEDTSEFTRWLNGEMAKGKLYAWYDPYKAKPVGKLESTAVYALAAVYAQHVGEKELCARITRQMNRFRVKDKASAFYGGFGNPQNSDFYSFDNLTALWALNLEGD